MKGTLVSLIDFLTARDRCPCCGAARAEPPKGQPAQWHAHRVAFACGASFVALGEAIRCEVACPERSRLAAKLWTLEAGPRVKPEDDGGKAEDAGAGTHA